MNTFISIPHYMYHVMDNCKVEDAFAEKRRVCKDQGNVLHISADRDTWFGDRYCHVLEKGSILQYPSDKSFRYIAWETRRMPQPPYQWYLVSINILATRATKYDSGIPYDDWKLTFDGAHLGTATRGIGSGFFNCRPPSSTAWTPGVNNLPIGMVPLTTVSQDHYSEVMSLLSFNHIVGMDETIVQPMVISLADSIIKAASINAAMSSSIYSAVPLGRNQSSKASYGYRAESSIKAVYPVGFSTKYDEEQWILSMPKPYRLVKSPYELNWLEEHALMEAVSNVPRMNSNTPAFLRDTIQLLWGLRKGKIDLKGLKFSDYWLTYRYTYCTTKMDVLEILHFWDRNGGNLLDTWTICRGSAKYNDTTCRCTVRVRNKIVENLQLLIRELDRYGLTPTWYMMWDSTPFSFMVDWFVPIGDLLDVADANRRYFKSEWYEFDFVTYSLSYLGMNDFGDHLEYYSRYVSPIPDSIQGLYWLDPGGSDSIVTITKRGLDVYSIFLS